MNKLLHSLKNNIINYGLDFIKKQYSKDQINWKKQ